jgi:hypothetical protein
MDNPEKLAILGTQDEDKQKGDHHTRYVLNAIVTSMEASLHLVFGIYFYHAFILSTKDSDT